MALVLAKYLVLLVTPITQILGQSDTRIEKLSKQAYLIFQDLFIYCDVLLHSQ